MFLQWKSRTHICPGFAGNVFYHVICCRFLFDTAAGSEEGLRALYADPLAAVQASGGLAVLGEDAWAHDDSPAAAAALTAALPAHVLERLAAPLGVCLEAGQQEPRQAQQAQQQLPQQPNGAQLGGAQQHDGEVLDPPLAAVAAALGAAPAQLRVRLLRHAIHAIVGASSQRQAAAGVLTAGLGKSVRYGLAKLRKAWR